MNKHYCGAPLQYYDKTIFCGDTYYGMRHQCDACQLKDGSIKTVLGTPSVQQGPPPIPYGIADTKFSVDRLRQERDMGYNEGWLAAIAHLEETLETMKGQRR